MKMEKDKEGLKANLDVMVIFDRAINVCEDSIYGFITSSDLCEDADTIQSYIGYLVGAERFEKKKGVISEDGTLWTYPDEIYTIIANEPLKKFTSFLFNDEVGYKIMKYDHPIEWEEGEIDNYDGTPCFIFKKELIERYI